jgi:MarR family transcriptional regulator, organic hydroperoxide resistance regulator
MPDGKQTAGKSAGKAPRKTTAKAPAKRVARRRGELPIMQVVLRHWLETAPNDRLAHLLRDTVRGFYRALQVRLAEHGVSHGHWSFLRVLWEGDGLTQRELSMRAGLTEPTAFYALRALESLGYVTRRATAERRRRSLVFLTAKGQALRGRLEPLAQEVNAIATRGIETSDIATTRRTLLAIIENLAGDEVETTKEDRRVPSTRELSRRLDAADPARRRPVRNATRSVARAP